MNVYVDNTTRQKLWTIIESLDTEVGGFGYAKLDGADVIWDDVFLVPQVVSHSEVEFDGGGIAAAVDRAAADERLGSEGFVWVSWHSHHSMKPFWSNTDESCINTYADAGVPHLLSFVGCHDHEYRMRFDMFDVEHHGITIPQVTLDKLTLTPNLEDEALKAIHDEIALNVRKRVNQWQKKTYGTLAKTAPPAPTKAERREQEQNRVAAAFEIKDLGNSGMSYEDACELVEHDYGITPDNGFLVGPAGLEREVNGGFDQQAWDVGD